MKHRNTIRAALTAAVVTAALTGTVTVASADATASASDDAHTFNPNEAGLFELQAPAPDSGMVQPMNFTSSLSGWAPGSKESRHWADNDYTEIQFTGCTMDGATGRSVGVKLWQAIPLGRDKDMGMKTFTNCFTGSNETSKGEWSGHYNDGDNRYFTIPELNGADFTHAKVSVRTVYVDTSKAD
ncbi:hypothetical protein KUF83_28765 [Streptomyces sp. BV286]|uniref:hypothetical protein n=1 Tax=Streptomyces sp. BV286 TaxID=2849672 RepID=UPI001C2E6898|nr:hypothetical protein [Streptomyces sp. BV286]MBV1940533.1 hypothetical protein [Streptomyces sp. BV286]